MLRRLVATAWISASRMNGQLPVYRETVLALKTMLGIETSEALAAARSCDRVQAFNATDWGAFARRSRSGLLRDIRAMKVSGDYSVDDDRSVVVAGMHSGSLPLAIGWFSQNMFRGWPILIVKTREGDADERGFMSRLEALGVEVRLVLPHGSSTLGALRSARRRTLIVCMADLPPSYGRSREAEILWHRWTLATHYIDLARICRARLLFFAARSTVLAEHLAIEGPFDVEWDADGEANALHEAITALLHAKLLAHPGQWHLWDRVDEYHVSAFA